MKKFHKLVLHHVLRDPGACRFVYQTEPVIHHFHCFSILFIRFNLENQVGQVNTSKGIKYLFSV